MRSDFRVEFSKTDDNLHVNPSGNFNGSSASELVNLIHEQYDGKGRIFVDTRNLRAMCPFGCTTFQCRLNQNRVPANRLFFKGEKGFEIAPEGASVIVTDEKRRSRCNGDCANCPCAKKGEKQ